MAYSDDELEPLFDYSRVQPSNFVCLDDDSDSSPPISLKRRKVSNPADVKGKKKVDVVNVIDCEAVDDSVDWLAPPPINLSDLPKPEENSIIRELRLKKEQLASFAQSAEDVFQDVEESARKAFCSSSKTCDEPDVEPSSNPPVNRAKIVIRFQDKNGEKPFRVFVDEKFERLFKMYSEKAKMDNMKFVFCFDGEKISPTATPGSLEMEDEDIIEVHVKSN